MNEEITQPFIPRNHILFYGSSYDRGLKYLLDMWPTIKEKYADAELHICYGWETFDSAYADNPERQTWKRRMEELIAQPGIVHHGRLGKQKLHELRTQCGIWAYPTDFPEINCITALEAQKDGCVPCVINKAALAETVHSGYKVNGDIADQETKDRYLAVLLELMGNEEVWKQEQQKGVLFTQELSWQNIAKKWSEILM